MGPNIEGKWFNPKTGVTLNVRQMIDDGENAVVVTDMGTIPMQDFMDFIQVADDKVYDENGNVIGNADTFEQPIAPSEPPIDKKKLDKMFSKPLNGKTVEQHLEQQEASQQSSKIVVETRNVDDEIMDRIFKKIKDVPKIKFSIDWGSFPIQSIIMTAETLDIAIKDIGSEIIKRYLKPEDISEFLIKEIEGR